MSTRGLRTSYWKAKHDVLAARLAKLAACADNELSDGQWVGRGPGQKFKDALAEAKAAPVSTDSAEPRESPHDDQTLDAGRN